MAGNASHDPGRRRRSGRRRAWLGVELLVAVALTGLLALTALGFILTATGAARSSASHVGQAAGAVICLALVVLCTRWVIHIEHRLRGRPGLAAGQGPSTGRMSSRRRRGGRRARGPVATVLTALLFAALTVGAIGGAISEHAQGTRSAEVQHHGLLSAASVDSVRNTEHCSRSGCSYTAAIHVRLSEPRGGLTATTVHYPAFAPLLAGEPVLVLVDPHQPGYAEIPGKPFKGNWSWVVFALMAVFCATLAGFEARPLRGMLAHRLHGRLRARAQRPGKLPA